MGFDANQPFEAVAEPADAPAFDPNQPHERIDQPADWKSAFAGLDAFNEQTPRHQIAIDYLNKRIGPDKENRAQAANMSYVQTQLPGWSMSALHKNWPSIRQAYAKESGFTGGEEITDSTLYGHIGKMLDEQQRILEVGRDLAEKTQLAEFGQVMQQHPEVFRPKIPPQEVSHEDWGEIKAVGSFDAAKAKFANSEVAQKGSMFWASINKPFKEIPFAPKMPDVPSLGPTNPALVAGAWNGILKPIIEGVETPVGAATFGIGGAAKAGVPLAKQALLGISGLFTALMAKSVAKNAPEAYRTVQDPTKTTQEKIEAVGPVLTESTLGLLGAMHIVTEVYPNAPKVVAEMDGKTPAQSAELLRKEANTTADPKAVDALNHAADKLEELPKPPAEEVKEAKKQQAQEEKAAAQESKPEPKPIAPAELNSAATEEGFPETWNLTEDIPGHGKGSTVSRETLEKAGFEVPQPNSDPKPAEAPAVSPAEVQKAFGIKNKAVNSTLKEMGEEPATKGEKSAWEHAVKDAQEKLSVDPEAGMKLVDELMAKPRPVTGNEDALLAHEVTRLSLEREAAARQLKEAEALGDENAIAQAQERVRSIKEDYQNSADVFAQVGTANSHGLSFRAMMLKEDYSLAKIERDFQEATGRKETTPAESAKIAELTQKVKEAEEKYAAYRKRASELLMNPDFPGFKPKAQRWIVKTIGEQAAAARERIALRLEKGYGLGVTEGESKGGVLSLENLTDLSIVGADHIIRGLDTFADWAGAMIKEYGDIIKPHLSEIWEEAKQIKESKEQEKFINRQKSALEKRIKELEAKIKTGNISPEGKPVNRPALPELESLKQSLDSLNEKVEELKKEKAKEAAPEEPKKQPLTEEEKRLNAKKGRLTRTRDELQRRIAENDITPKGRKDALRLDEEGAELEAEVNKAKEEVQKMIYRAKEANKTTLEKVPDVVTKWRRGFLLSSPVTLAKLTSAAVQRLAFTPLEEAVGAGLGKLPGISTIAENAPREGGFSGSAEARSLVDAFTKGFNDAGQVLKTGKGVLEQSAGHKPGQVKLSDLAPRSVIDFFGNIHGALKAPVKRAEFTRSFAKRVQFAEEHGVDISDPLVQTRLATEAYKDANRSIFMQDNMITDAYKRALSRFEEVNKETGKPTLAGQAAATAMRVLFPIVKVPTNVVGETFTYATGSLTGTAKTIHASLTKGLENLTPNESDMILRQLKKGSVGAAALLYGYFNPQMFGGYYQAGEKRKDNEAQAGGARIEDTNIPRVLLHNPLMEQFQIGATIRRVADSKLHKHDQQAQGELNGAIAAGLGLVEEVPFARESVELGKLFDPHERDYAGGELLKSIFVPAVLDWTAKMMDRDEEGNPIKRKPHTVMQHVESGIPLMRENVPTKSSGLTSPR